MKYSKITTQDHPVSKRYSGCLTDFNLIISKEGYNGDPLFTNEEIVLNLDLVEDLYAAEMQQTEKNQSMDSAFCIADSNTNQIVLVEYKFNHAGFRSLRKADMEGKVAGSIEILAPFMPVYYRFFFVVQEELINQAYSRFFRMNPKPGNQYTPISIQSLKDMFF